ncbi:hypothetical protein Btru_035014 [Bulinus truncatus]|nr:hypothetical protein Btru_035014 [Bulinus truncatus]
MASMQSPRTQCCCCAVGVFTAMFGIFMLSAGICIVLNVTFMEVDTSGLPPELHNEEGKKVVGIILICVSLGALGVSATVSVVYFVVCSAKIPPKSSAQANVEQQQHSSGSISKTVHSGERTPGSATPTSGHFHGTARKQTPRSVSQSSLMERPTRRTSLQIFEGASRSASPKQQQYRGRSNLSTGNSPLVVPPRRPVHNQHQQPHNNRRGHNIHNIRGKRYKSGLQTHIEEDSEAARSVMDLQTLQKCGDVPSDYPDGVAAARLSIRSAHSVEFSEHRPDAPPLIVVDAWTTPASTLSDVEVVENHFHEFDELHRGLKMQQLPQTGSILVSNSLPLINGDDEKSDCNDSDFNIGHQSPSSSHRDSDEDLSMEPPLSPPYNTPSSPIIAEQTITIISVKSHHLSDDLDTTVPSHHDRNGHTERDRESGAVHQHPHHSHIGHHSPFDREETESRVSFNSMMSSDGQDTTDMDLVRQKMEELLHDDESAL